MYFKSKRISLLILGVTALVCARTMFWFFEDPEGPNLLVVTVMALIIYFLSLVIYLADPVPESAFRRFFLSSLLGPKRLLAVVFIQMVIATIFYLCLK